MSEPAGAPVAESPPPPGMLAVVNPTLRAVLSRPVGQRLLARTALGLVRYTGRRTGRDLRVVVGVHELEGRPVVLSSAPWMLNFRGGRSVALALGGRWRRGHGTLEEEPAVVAAALQALFDGGLDAQRVGLKVADGHRVTADDVRVVGRRLLRLDLAP